MRLQTDGAAITRIFEIAELCGPVDVPLVYRRPGDLAVGPLHRILHVAVMNTVLRQEIPPCREGVELTTHHGIAGVPIEGKMRRWYRRQGSGRFGRGGCVAFKLVFNDEQQTLPA